MKKIKYRVYDKNKKIMIGANNPYVNQFLASIPNTQKDVKKLVKFQINNFVYSEALVNNLRILDKIVEYKE